MIVGKPATIPPTRPFTKSRRPLIMKTPCLPVQLPLNGDLAAPQRTADLPEKRAGRVQLRPAPVWMVQCVLRLRAHFEIHLFPNTSGFNDRHRPKIPARVARPCQHRGESAIVI